MARQRSFDLDEVLTKAHRTFIQAGYNGTSVGDLLEATGIHRSSLYQAFGSKRGLFLDVLRQKIDLDICLIAMMDLCPSDGEVREIVAHFVNQQDEAPDLLLGRRLMHRAGLLLGEEGKHHE